MPDRGKCSVKREYLFLSSIINLIFKYDVFAFSICNLYKWRYKQLGNLKHVENWPEYQRGNAGFAFDFQLIDVQDFNGVGESEPNPYFYQVIKLLPAESFLSINFSCSRI